MEIKSPCPRCKFKVRNKQRILQVDAGSTGQGWHNPMQRLVETNGGLYMGEMGEIKNNLIKAVFLTSTAC